jgi:hypothetical protein
MTALLNIVRARVLYYEIAGDASRQVDLLFGAAAIHAAKTPAGGNWILRRFVCMDFTTNTIKFVKSAAESFLSVALRAWSHG